MTFTKCHVCFEWTNVIQLPHTVSHGDVSTHSVCVNCKKQLNNICPFCRGTLRQSNIKMAKQWAQNFGQFIKSMFLLFWWSMWMFITLFYATAHFIDYMLVIYELTYKHQ